MDNFLEIYNEKVRDLLGSEETVATSGNFSLRVREHPKLGPYVQGLSEHLVTDKKKLLELLATGNSRRSTAATENNTHSSRSHAVFTIQFRQYDIKNFETEKFSKVHLVDLAGSERASSSQSKERLKEGANINKSLVTLGNVVSALAEGCDTSNLLKIQSNSKGSHCFVPYRDSVLTRLLKDTLGGNSNTIMIATVSPASSCLSETVNTLRYAKRTKRIVNQPVVNEDPKVRTIRQLRGEIVRLKRLLLSFRSTKDEIHNQNRNDKKSFIEAENDCEGVNGNRAYENEKNRKNFEDLVASSANDCEGGVLSEGNACKINDEKKSDVNGSVNDSFSHETQIFSNGLDSFSPLFHKSENGCEPTDDSSGRFRTAKNYCKLFENSAEKFTSGLIKDFRLFENMPKKKVSAILHRSRPDLIKGISSKFKEGPRSGSSQSCTDVSNLSQSMSDNSLNSSGSADVPYLEKKLSANQRIVSLISQETVSQLGEIATKKKGNNSEASQSTEKKKEKRSEIVDAVTGRLYATKKKPDDRGMVLKQDVQEDNKLEELKQCKRARMKLFDLSRKLALNRKMKKTMDNNTQTDNVTATLRVKEKCVTTELEENSHFEEVEILEENIRGKRPYVIMNQVFIPQASNYLVECGEVVRIESPETVQKQKSATQTSPERYNNVSTSPIKFNFKEEECFSEDSLESEDKARYCELLLVGEPRKLNREPHELNSETHFFYDSENGFKENSKAHNFIERKKPDKKVLDVWPLTVFSKGIIYDEKLETEIPLLDPCENSSEEWKKEETQSSENSFGSVEETDASISSETSSEDLFVFFESSKDKDSTPKAKSKGIRKLYTITENSEQSDLNDEFSPESQSRNFPFHTLQEREPQGSQNRSPERRIQKTEVELKMRDRSTEAIEPRIKDEYHERKQTCKETGSVRKNSAKDKLNMNFTQTLNPYKCFFKNLEVPKPIFPFIKAETTFQNPDRVPRSSGESTTGKKTKIKYLHPESFQYHSKEAKTDSKSTTWTDQSHFQKQYLNLNIPSSNSDTRSAFSVDTHLFNKTLRKDQSGETMFNSTDSITFVFMGPAKPKTSVLMEIIRRSLGKTLFQTNQTPFVQKMSRSRGVQCGPNLMRSVSIDSAMIALSRIAKNQDICGDLQRTTSLRTMSPNETPAVIVRGENSFQWDLNEDKTKKNARKDLVAGSKSLVENDKKQENEETEKPKKSVSWSGEAKHEVKLEGEISGFGLNYTDFSVMEAEDSNEENLERRVRFSKAETRNFPEIQTKEEESTSSPELNDPLKAFLKEATQLLKNINFRSTKCPGFFRQTLEKSTAETNQKHCGLNSLKNTDFTFIKSKLEKDVSSQSRIDRQTDASKASNLTWPKMRPATGKPPTGMKSKFFMSFSPSRSTSLHSNGFPDSTKNCSQSSRVGSRGQSWNLSSPSVLSGDDQGRSPGSQVSYYNESQKHKRNEDSYSSLRTQSPRLNVPHLNFESISKLEEDVEESCCTLEMLIERDRMREIIIAGQKKNPEGIRHNVRLCCRSDASDAGQMEVRKVIKRRKQTKCNGGCICGSFRADSCKYLWSKGCISSFELDSFGPGSAHCHQLCMFCRKKDAEIYSSTVNLNSECSSDFCRLNYYGFCPCSSARLNHVSSSPRAYMQRLLALRRRIVSQTKET